MEINALEQLKKELESFKLVATASMVGAATTLAYSISIGFNEILPFIIGGPIGADFLPYLLVIISGFATAISWVTRSTELMNNHDEIVKELNKIISESRSPTSDRRDLDEKIIGIIVKSVGFYRENSSKIKRLKWIGRLTGLFLLVISIPQLVSFLNGTYPAGGAYVIAQIFLVVFSIGVSITAWYVPFLITRYMDTWDARLNLAEEANYRLGRSLEGNL